MGERLRHLILEAWEHDHLPGPETDLKYQERQRAEWITTLTVEDCLLILSWLAAPVVPEEWGVDRSWHRTLISGVPYYVGRAGRRLDDDRIRQAVAGLIEHPVARPLGLLCAQELRDPELVPLLLGCLRDRENRCDVVLGLASCVTTHELQLLRQRAASSGAGDIELSTLDEVIFEWGEVHQGEQDSSADQDQQERLRSG
jgi:hypothetical protein